MPERLFLASQAVFRAWETRKVLPETPSEASWAFKEPVGSRERMPERANPAFQAVFGAWETKKVLPEMPSEASQAFKESVGSQERMPERLSWFIRHSWRGEKVEKEPGSK